MSTVYSDSKLSELQSDGVGENTEQGFSADIIILKYTNKITDNKIKGIAFIIVHLKKSYYKYLYHLTTNTPYLNFNV